jgi:ribonuclease D
MATHEKRQDEPWEGGTALPPFTLVDNADAWADCIARMAAEPRVAVDVESNSLYAYRESVCLIQFSIPGHDYIVDPLAGFALDGLGELLKDPKVEKVLHASEYDLILFKRLYDWDIVHLFDTMWAARVLGYKRMGLAGFLSDFFEVDQRKRFQKANWAKRPLTADQLAYARIDTHYLLALRDIFEAELREAGKWDEAREIFGEIVRVRVPERMFDPEMFWSVRGTRDLGPREQAVMRELFIMRDMEAARRDLPPFKVLNNEGLIALAKAQPTSLAELDRVHGVSSRLRDRLSRLILDAVKRGKDAPLPRPRRRQNQHSQEAADRYDKLQDWRKRVARERDVESDVVLNRDAMWAIADANPSNLEALSQCGDIGPHRLAQYGEDILRVLE